jgi:carbon monoxide dehydrogenase subunit G
MIALALAAALTGQPWMEVAADGGATVIRAGVDIAAPPEVVWGVIHDCAQAGRLMRKLKSCKVLEAGPGWDVREHIIKPDILPSVRTVVRSEYDPPRGVRFVQAGGEVSQQGRWRLEAIAGGTRATYENRIVLGLPVAEPLFRAAIRAEGPKGLANLRRAAEMTRP